ncbi:MAG: hypothetical protein R3C56_41395 [Pirellulaceae bacterium]
MLDLTLTRHGWFWDQSMLMIALALPLSQIALLTIVAAVVPMALVLRFALPSFGAVAGWYLLSQILPWGVGEEATAAWALALVAQVVTIFLAVECYWLSRNLRPANETECGDVGRPSPFTFGMRTLMLWTTVVGLGFGFIQFGRRSWQWTAAVFQWEYLGAMPIIGVANGLVAALWLWALATDGLAWQSAKVVTAVLMAGGLAILQCYAAEWITGAYAMNLKESLIVVASQSVFVSASLAVAKAPRPKAS